MNKKIKKISSIASASALAFSNLPLMSTNVSAEVTGEGTEASPYLVKNEAELKEALNKGKTISDTSNFIYVKLANNIEITNMDDYREISNINLSGENLTITVNGSINLFETIKNSNFKNTKFVFTKKSEENLTSLTGLIANTADNTSFTGCIVSCDTITSEQANNNLAAFIGTAKSPLTFSNCLSIVPNAYGMVASASETESSFKISLSNCIDYNGLGLVPSSLNEKTIYSNLCYDPANVNITSSETHKNIINNDTELSFLYEINKKNSNPIYYIKSSEHITNGSLYSIDDVCTVANEDNNIALDSKIIFTDEKSNEVIGYTYAMKYKVNSIRFPNSTNLTNKIVTGFKNGNSTIEFSNLKNGVVLSATPTENEETIIVTTKDVNLSQDLEFTIDVPYGTTEKDALENYKFNINGTEYSYWDLRLYAYELHSSNNGSLSQSSSRKFMNILGTSYNLTVKYNVKVSKIELEKEKLSYTMGESLDITEENFKVYSDDSTYAIVKGVDLNLVPIPNIMSVPENDQFSVSTSFKNDQNENVNIIIPVEHKEYESLEYKSGIKSEYKLLDVEDFSNLKLNEIFSTEGKEEKEKIEISPSNLTPATVRTKTTKIKVTVNGKSIDILLPLKSIESVSLKDSTPLIFTPGQKLDISDVKINVKYTDDENIQEVKLGDLGYSETDALASNTTAINLSVLDNSLKIPVKSSSIQSVSVKANPNKLSYRLGEDVSYEGLVLTATYDDGSTKDITLNDIASLPAQTIISNNVETNFKYQDKEFTIPFTVETPDTIVYSGDPLEFTTTTPISLASTQFTATYNDPSKTYNFIGSDVFSNDNLNQTISDKNTKNLTVQNILGFGINVDIPLSYVSTVQSVELSEKSQYKNVYKNTESFDPSGVVLNVTYSDGTTEEVAYSDTNASDFTYDNSNLDINASNVTLTYKGKNISVPLSVIYDTSNTYEIESLSTYTLKKDKQIKLTEGLFKVYETEDDKTNGNGIQLTGKQLNLEDYTPNTHIKSLSYKYANNTKTLEIPIQDEVLKVEGILDADYSITQEELFDYSKLNIKITYASGYDTTILASTIQNLPEKTVDENTTSFQFNITIDEKTYPITVQLKPSIEGSLKIKDNCNYKKDYIEGQVFDPTDLVLIYTDAESNETELNSTQFTYPTEELKLGATSVSITYEGLTIDVPITTTFAKTVSCVIKQDINKKSYKDGEKADFTGLVLEVTYDNGKKIDDASWAEDLNNNAPILTSGQTTIPITVTYHQLDGETQAELDSQTYNLTIENITVSQKDVKKVEITTPPDKVNYKEGEKFDPTGMVVTITYDDNSTSTQTSFEELKNTVIVKDQETVNFSIVIDGNTYNLSQPITVTNKTIKSIELTKQPTKLEYAAGEKFDPSGMEVTITYDDETTEVVPLDESNFSSLPTLTKNTTEVELDIFGHKIVVSNITVSGPEVTLAKVTKISDPTKLVYNVGEKFDPAGLQIKKEYSDGSTEIITISEQENFEPFSTPGNSTITIIPDKQYPDLTITVDVTVNDITSDKNIVSVVLKTLPSKTTYKPGELFDPSGMELLITYDDDTTEIKSDFSEYDFSTPITSTTNKITVPYKTFSVDVDISVVSETNKIKSIGFNQLPKSEYNIGDTFDPSGIKLVVTYTDGVQKLIEDGFDISVDSPLNSNTNKFSVTYEGKTIESGLKVNKTVSSVEMLSKPTKLEYEVGETLDISGLKLKVNYTTNNYSEIIDNLSSEDISGLDKVFTTSGTSKITFTYQGQQLSFDVNVKKPEEKTITSVEIVSLPTKIKYGDEPELIDLSGLTLKLTYNDNSTETKSIEDINLDLNGQKADRNTTAIYFKLDEVEVRVPLNGNSIKEATKVEIAQLPSKLKYGTDLEEFDPTGLIFKVYYKDGTTQEKSIENYNFNFKDYKVNKNTKSITLSVEGFPVNIYLNGNSEKEVQSVSVKTLPNKTHYGTIKEQLDLTGTTFTITYIDGTSVEKSIDVYPLDFSDKMVDNNTSKVYLEIEGKSVAIPLNGNSAKDVSSVQIDSMPTKIMYGDTDEQFDPTGLKFKVIYTDGTSEVKSIDVYNKDFSDILCNKNTLRFNLSVEGKTVIIPLNGNSSKKASKVEIASMPTRTRYGKTDEKFDITGLSFKITYEDKTTEIKSASVYNPKYFDISVNNTVKSLNLNIENQSVSVELNNQTITNISLVNMPSKVNYGDTTEVFDPTGTTINVEYSDGSSETNSLTYYVEDFSSVKVNRNTKMVRIYINEKDFVDIPLNGNSLKTTKAITIKNMPNKVNYETTPEAFDPTGLILSIEYTDGTKEDKSIEDFNFDFSKQLVSKSTKSISFFIDDVEVVIPLNNNSTKKITNMEIATMPTKTKYGDSLEQFDPSGLTFKVTYEDGTSEIKSAEDYNLSFPDSKVNKNTANFNFTFMSFKFSIPLNNTSTKTIANMEIATMPSKTEYGDTKEQFNPDGLTFKITYTDGTSETKSATDLNLSFDNLLVDKNTSNVEFSYLSFKFTIPLNGSHQNPDSKKITNVEIATMPTKTQYSSTKEQFKSAGLSFKITYADGSTSIKTPEELNIDFSNIYVDKNTPGVKVKIDNYEVNIPLNGNQEVEKEISKVEVATMPTKTEYTSTKEQFKSAGLTLKVTYTDGTTSIKTPEELGVVFTNVYVDENTKEVSFDIGQSKITIPLNINKPQKKISSVKINTLPNKTNYLENEKFDPTGLTLLITYADGSTEVISPTGNNDIVMKSTMNLITYKYEGFSVYIPVKVSSSENKTIKDVYLTKLPTKTSYLVGETMDYTGMEITIIYSDNSSKVITDFSNLNRLVLDSESISNVDVIVENHNISIPVKVTKSSTPINKKIKKATLLTKPNNLKYKAGDIFDPTGMQIELTYDDGSTEIIKNFSQFGNINITKNTSSVSYTFGSQTITININNISNNSSQKNIISIDIVSNPYKTEYYIGENVSLEGLELKVTYSDGTTKTFTSKDFSNTIIKVKNFQKSVSLNVESSTVSIPITVKESPSFNIESDKAWDEIYKQIDTLPDDISIDIVLDGITKIPSNVLDRISDKNLDVKFISDKSNVNITSDSLKHISKDLDFSISTSSNNISEKLFDYLIENSDGSSQFTITSTIGKYAESIDLSVNKSHAYDEAVIYGFNADTNMLEYLDTKKVSSDGCIYGIKVNSDYTDYLIVYNPTNKSNNNNSNNTSSGSESSSTNSNTSSSSNSNNNKFNIEYYVPGKAESSQDTQKPNNASNVGLGAGINENNVSLSNIDKKNNDLSILKKITISTISISIALVAYKKKKKEN